jgi:DNA-binding response OmpR family regulator
MTLEPAAGTTLHGQPHVVVVDDDEEVRSLLRRYLGTQSLRISVAPDGQGLRALLRGGDVDLVLLDLGLAGEDGLDVLREVRRDWHGAVIIVSGRGEAVERIVGLEIGADDYVTKPFDLRELLARIRSVLRRVPAQRAAPPGEAAEAEPASRSGRPAALLFAGFRLEPDSRRLLDPAGHDVPLTTGEFDLLLALLRGAQRVLTRDQLMNALHGRDAGPFDRAIDAQVLRLRRKLGDPADHPVLIKSVRGAGYLLAVDVHRG